MQPVRTLKKKLSLIAAVLLMLGVGAGVAAFETQSVSAAVNDCTAQQCPAGEPRARRAISFWYNQGYSQNARVVTTAVDSNNRATRVINGGAAYDDRDGQLSRFFVVNGYSMTWVQSMDANEYDVNDRPVGSGRDAERLVVAGVPGEKYIFYTNDHYANFWLMARL